MCISKLHRLLQVPTNSEITNDGEKDKPDAKSKKEGKVRTKPDTESNTEHKQDVKVIRTNLTSSSKKKTNLIRIRSLMRKKR